MKKLLLILFFPILLFVIIIAGFLWFNDALLAPSNETAKSRFVITKGSSAETIAKGLENNGFIKNAFAFKLYLQFNNKTKSLAAGEFSLAKNLTVEEVIKALQSGPTQIWVTIPEGLRREEIPDKFITSLELSPTLAQTFTDEFLSLTKDLEGFLFPDTYLFPKEASAAAVVKRLTSTFDQKISSLEEDIAKSGRSRKDIITLASILERETRNAKTEGPIVAGILLKRMKEGWPLQADATAQYAIGKEPNWWPTPTRADLEVDSVFNTYKILGLPPHPIASPGLEAIKASLYPEESEYWYYIHDTDGVIHYAKTLAEHNRNVDIYLR